MDYKNNEYRRRIGIFRARSCLTRGQLEREKVVPFLLPNNHIRLDDQDNAQVVVPTKLNLTKRVRFSCSYERRIEPHSEMSKAEKDRLWCWCGAKDVDVRSFEQDFVSVWSVANKAHLEHPEVAFYWKADKFRVENAYKNQPSRIGGDIYRGIPTKKAQGVRKLPVITWEGLLGRNAYRSIQPKTKQYIITEAAIRWDKYQDYLKKPGHTWERTGFMKWHLIGSIDKQSSFYPDVLFSPILDFKLVDENHDRCYCADENSLRNMRFLIFRPCRLEYKVYESFANCPNMKIKSISTKILAERLKTKQREVEALTERLATDGGDHGGDHDGASGGASGGHSHTSSLSSISPEKGNGENGTASAKKKKKKKKKCIGTRTREKGNCVREGNINMISPLNTMKSNSNVKLANENSDSAEEVFTDFARETVSASASVPTDIVAAKLPPLQKPVADTGTKSKTKTKIKKVPIPASAATVAAIDAINATTAAAKNVASKDVNAGATSKDFTTAVKKTKRTVHIASNSSDSSEGMLTG